MGELTGLIWLAAILLAEGVVAAARLALMNIHPPTLQHLQDEGVMGAALAARIGSEASRTMFSTGAALAALRLATLGLAWAATAPLHLTEGGRVAVGLAGGAVLLGLVEAGAQRVVLGSADRWAARLAPLAAALAWGLSPLQPLAAALVGSSQAAYPVVTEEEIKTLVDAGEEGGAIEEEEKEMIYSIFQLGDTLAREVMVPRIDIQAFDERWSLRQVTEALQATGHSRAPVYRGTIDHVVGLVYVKDLLTAWKDGRQDEAVGGFVRPALFVPEAKKAGDLLAELQARRVHAAIVVDEYGGTAGLVTVEDILEEIVGEIRDEYDLAEEAAYQQVREDEFILSGRMDLDDVNDLAGASLPKDTSDTLAGFIYGRLGRIPPVGAEIEAGGLRLVVEKVTGRRIEKVRARRLPTPTEETEADGVDG
ncbi:MAG TPA: hemolysin family protein [Anaerolineales bacterium]|nr:hemolysin family protein [Anaerolineales bacterium]